MSLESPEPRPIEPRQRPLPRIERVRKRDGSEREIHVIDASTEINGKELKVTKRIHRHDEPFPKRPRRPILH